MLKKLVLFDIDGTLLSMTSANRRILADALLAVYGTAGSSYTHNFAGKMDSAIIYEVLAADGLTRKEVASRFDLAKEMYITFMQKVARVDDVTLMPGIVELLDALAERDDVLLGLLTGNFEGSGRHKLHLASINHYFPFGAFADDAEHRNQLPAIAVTKAHQRTGITFSEHNIIIIGDTEHDIACARAVQAKSIAVATGTYAPHELEAHEPHLLYHNFSDTQAVLNDILSH
uniref:Hydrolase, haloacid dehalogenase-like family n=1 Tax=Chlorobium chlorochromatii (strain CaD3) TaxID=340177 RepID=Q3ATI4_CHLCH